MLTNALGASWYHKLPTTRPWTMLCIRNGLRGQMKRHDRNKKSGHTQTPAADAPEKILLVAEVKAGDDLGAHQDLLQEGLRVVHTRHFVRWRCRWRGERLIVCLSHVQQRQLLRGLHRPESKR